MDRHNLRKSFDQSEFLEVKNFKLWILFVPIRDESFLVQLLKVPAFFNDILYLISFTLFLCFLATAFVVLWLNPNKHKCIWKNDIFKQCEPYTFGMSDLSLSNTLLVRGPMAVLHIDLSLFTPCKWLVYRSHLCLLQ